MYKVYVRYAGADYPLYEPLDDEMRIFDPVLTETAGGAGTFLFRINRGHPNFDRIKACKSEIILYWDDEALFYGRVFRPEQGFDNIVTFTCEGELTYLLDSIQRPFSFTGNISNYIGKLLDEHNKQVEADKRVEKGNIVVAADSGDIVWSLTEHTQTLAVLRAIKDTYGGYLKIRHAAGKRYLDYVCDYGGINSQAIRFGDNLLDLTKYVDASQIITCLIPIGGEVEYKDELGEKQKRSVDITSVNNGKDYIENPIAVEQFGRIFGTQNFDEITDPQKLLTKATAYLEEASALPESIVINAIDLSLIDADIEQLRTGYWTDVLSTPHGIEQRYMLSQREINLLDPTQGSVTLGRGLDTFTGNINRSQAAISARVEKVAAEAIEEINRKVENATELITGGLGGYVVLDNIDPVTGKKIHPWRVLIMNTPDKETAKHVIQINQNGFGFSTTGINGPYRNAWTIDGNLLADFITAGRMLADRIRGGTLEVGGSGLGKDGIILVLSASGQEICRLDKSGVKITDGTINSPKIIGGSAYFGNGLFEANDNTVYIGGFYAMDAWGREIFQSYDGQCGMSSDPAKKGGLWFWAGWNNENDYDFCVNNLGQVHCRELYIESNQDFWKGWSMSDTMRDVYNRLSDLQDQIDNIG